MPPAVRHLPQAQRHESRVYGWLNKKIYEKQHSILMSMSCQPSSGRTKSAACAAVSTLSTRAEQPRVKIGEQDRMKAAGGFEHQRARAAQKNSIHEWCGCLHLSTHVHCTGCMSSRMSTAGLLTALSYRQLESSSGCLCKLPTRPNWIPNTSMAWQRCST